MPDEAISGPPELADVTIATLIAQHATIRPGRPAFVTSNGAVLTYGALFSQIAAFGAALRANGVGRTAKVAILMPEGIELAVVIVAVACHAVAVPLNPKMTATEIDNLFARLRIDAIVISNEIDTAVRDVAARVGLPVFEIAGRSDGRINVSAVGGSSSHNSEVALDEGASPDAPAVILQTSATTGRPKLVPITHRNLIIDADQRRFWFKLTPDDRALCVLPLYYGQGLKGAVFAPLLIGASIACPDHNAAGDILDWLADLQPTWLDGGATFHMSVLERALARQGAQRHCLRFIRSGGELLPTAIRQRLEEIFCVPVLECYGLSEASTVAANSIVPENRKPGTVGKPWLNEVAIRAADGRTLPPSAAGEIVVRGPALTPGYIDDEEANRAAFVNGWFRTGDLGLIDDEGFLTVLGRLKEFINRGSEKISPYEVERALLLHPSVREAAAFSVPHPRLGENVAAAVVLRPGAHETPSEIKTFLLDRLAPFKIPQRVLVKPELPKGATGKVQRRLLSDEVAHCSREMAPPTAPLHWQILEIWQRLIGRHDIGIYDDFFEAGGDSLLATQMLCEVEAITGQRIPQSALRAVFTVHELADAVTRCSPATAELMTCAKQGSGTPFLFCHGDYSTRGFYALKLAEMLRCDQPVFLVHPHLDPDPKLTFEEMARDCLPHILAAHPTGAFCVGGHCNGGLLAWEIAHQLELLGREVEFITLVDVISLNARTILRLIAHLKKFIVVVAPKRMSEKFALDGMRAVWARGDWYRSYGGPYSCAMPNYVPPKLTARVLCVISEESRTKMEYSSIPWSNLIHKVDCEYIAGTHLSCITKHADELARILDRWLSQAMTRS
jgi:acyl-CoA synthetase (AMP-forming)/AMP-acid ligase II